MRRLIYLGLLVAASLLTLDVKPASACDWWDGDGYNTSVAPRAYGYASTYGYYGRGYYGRTYGYRRAYGYAPTYGYYGSYYGRGYYGGAYGYSGYGARVVARGVVRRAAWRRWR